MQASAISSTLTTRRPFSPRSRTNGAATTEYANAFPKYRRSPRVSAVRSKCRNGGCPSAWMRTRLPLFKNTPLGPE